MKRILRRCSRSSKCLSLFFIAGLFLACASVQAAGAAEDPVVLALSARHFSATAKDLEKIAGGENALVSKLLGLRRSETPPFVGIRAETILLSNYAQRADVVAALEDDLNTQKYRGLARVVTLNLDTVGSAESKSRLARAAIQRVSTDSELSSLSKVLLNSDDSEVRKLARESLK